MIAVKIIATATSIFPRKIRRTSISFTQAGYPDTCPIALDLFLKNPLVDLRHNVCPASWFGA